ncbi:hypothetical protein M758_UG283800 [Ceratodon purpureus]|nr:hypothetical protein M758_UG283800 [Ceratodon purpureus]
MAKRKIQPPYGVMRENPSFDATSSLPLRICLLSQDNSSTATECVRRQIGMWPRRP